MIPKARQDKVLAEKVGDELVVYDQERHRAHRLNRTAALVWRHCDGQWTVAQLVAFLQRELHPGVDEDVVLMTLDQLEKARLLENVVQRSTEDKRVLRRQVMRKVSLVGLSLFLPAVVTLAVTPAQAHASVSGGGGGGDGGGGTQQ